MTWLRKEKRIETGTLGPNESYSVEVMVEVYWNPETQQEEDAFDGEASRKIEAAIEAVHPGWLHTCFETGHGTCRACQRAFGWKKI
jgi:hypothetical protein